MFQGKPAQPLIYISRILYFLALYSISLPYFLNVISVFIAVVIRVD